MIQSDDKAPVILTIVSHRIGLALYMIYIKIKLNNETQWFEIILVAAGDFPAMI